MAAGGGRSDGTGNVGAAGSGCGVVAQRRKKACHCYRGDGLEMASPEGMQRRMNAGKTWADC